MKYDCGVDIDLKKPGNRFLKGHGSGTRYASKKFNAKEKMDMGLCIRHPKRNKSCAFCNYWISDIKLTFVNSSVGFEYDHDAQGRCVKSNGKMRAYCYCPKYEPSIEAKKLL